MLPEILDWSSQRPAWQQDALRRIIIQEEITDDDISELIAMSMFAHSLTMEDGDPPEPQPFTEQDFSASSIRGIESVQLLGLRDLQHVNAIAPGQKLGFAPDGLTIVFGYNATGKSGYARILKRLCRARARGPVILPNVFESPLSRPAVATVDYRVGGSDRSLQWQDNQVGPPELMQISFFDSECASVHVSESNSLAFTPYGLDLLEKLADITKCVQQGLRHERGVVEQQTPDLIYNPQAAQETQVYQFLQRLSKDTDFERVSELGALSDQEQARLQSLTHLLSSNPAKQASEARQRRDRIQRLRTAITNIDASLSIPEVNAIQHLTDEFVTKRYAATIAAQELFSNQPLQNIGSDVWKQLWEAARRYSTQYAYPEEVFPVTREGARCVLCMQPLQDEASDRLHRFEQYVHGETQRQAASAKLALDKAILRLDRLCIRTQEFRDPLSDLGLLDDALRIGCRKYLIEARLRRRSIIRAAHTNDWGTLPPLPLAPYHELGAIVDRLTRHATECESAAQSTERVNLEKEWSELKARQWLGAVLEDVRNHIDRLRRIAAIDAAIMEASTDAITRKSTQLTREHVTKTLCNRFLDEVRRLGTHYLRIALQPVGGRYGSHLFQITLQGAANNIRATDVLSEGEQRSLALAGFLAELSTSSSYSAIVFDDPVSSLDQQWRRRVAERLVEEARLRQVIVFTHDVGFLMDLMKQCEGQDIPFTSSHLERAPDGVGRCLDGLHWVGMKVTDRIRRLNEMLQVARTVKNRDGDAAYESEARHIYGLLRETWERAVEEVLLNGAILRFQREVQTQKLRCVTDIEDGDIRAVDAGMAKCSRFLPGHDEAAEVAEPVPEPDEIAEDIRQLSDWAKLVRKRRT